MTNDTAWIVSCFTLVTLGALWLAAHLATLALTGKGLGLQRKEQPE